MPPGEDVVAGGAELDCPAPEVDIELVPPDPPPPEVVDV